MDQENKIQIHFRVTKEENDKIEENAQKAMMSKNAYIIRMALDGKDDQNDSISFNEYIKVANEIIYQIDSTIYHMVESEEYISEAVKMLSENLERLINNQKILYQVLLKKKR